MHALVDISPWSCYEPPHRAITSLFSSTIFWVWLYSREREREFWGLSEYPCTFGKSVCGNLLLEILSVHIISFEDFCKKIEAKKQPFDAPSPPYMMSFRFHLLPAAFVSCLALSFNFALLFECDNPWLECSLSRTPHIPTTSIFFLQEIAPPIFREFHQLVAGHPYVRGKNK
jgi:hypothetical protein